MNRWAVLVVVGCLLTLAGVVWYVHALEDHARPAWPVAVFLVGCVVVLAALVVAVQQGD